MATILQLKPERVLLLNYILESASYCSSLIGRDENGLVMMFRTLDFNYPDLLKNISYVGEFFKGGKKIHTSVMMGGSALFLTGFKDKKFAISMN